jgi:hypothetical protein
VTHGLAGGAAAMQHDEEWVRLAAREAPRLVRWDVQQVRARLACYAERDLRRTGLGGRRAPERAAPGGTAREHEED